MAQRWVLICGLIRNEAAMLEKLATLRAWREAGHIQGVVFSTWLGEIGRFPKVKSAFEGGEFDLVELQPPMLKTQGYTVHQSKTLFYGLHAVPEGSFVLKLRPDIGSLTEAILNSLFDTSIDLYHSSDWPDIFKYKILIAQNFLSVPYYMNDIIFYGFRDDLLKLANFDLSTEFVCINTAPEQFFFRGPFSGVFPQIDAYLQLYPHLIFDDAEKSLKRQDILLLSDFYLEVFATYLLIIKQYFRVGFVGDGIRRNRSPLPLYEMEAFFRADGRPDGLGFHFGGNASILMEERPLDALLEGHFVRNSLGARFDRALGRINDKEYRSSYPINPIRPLPEVRALQAAIAEAFPYMSHRLDEINDPAGRHFRVRGQEDRITLLAEDDQMRLLHEEINHLRRSSDELRRRLGDQPTHD